MVTIDGLVFDDVKVVAPNPVNGKDRTWTLSSPNGGHPLTIDMAIADNDRLGLTAATIADQLKEHA